MSKSRSDAGDGRGKLGEVDRLADHVHVAIVLRLPESCGDDDPGGRALNWRGIRRWRRNYGEVFVREPTARHRKAEQLEETFSYRVDLHRRRGAVVGDQGEVARDEACRPLDRELRIVQPDDLGTGQHPGGDASVGE